MKATNSFAQQGQGAQGKQPTFSMAIAAPSMQKMIQSALRSDKAAARLTSTLISAVNASEQLRACEPSTIVAAALRGEGMGLIFGHGYYVVPYGTTATYILGYKGYIQLAMSTGFYADIDCTDIREGEIEGRDRRTGKPLVNLAKYETDEERESHPIVGYYGYYELKDGTFRFEYWPMERLLRHADRYSKAFSYEKFKAMQSGAMAPAEVNKLLNGSPWYDPNGGQDRMCRKTILRQLLNSGYAPLSPEVKTQIMEDGGSEGAGVIPDIPMPERTVPATGEVVETAAKAVSGPQDATVEVTGVSTPPETENAAETPQSTADEAADYASTFFDN